MASTTLTMTPSELRKYIMDAYRSNKCNLRIAHAKCLPRLPDHSSLVYTGGCIAHHWSGEPFLDAIERVKRLEKHEITSIHTHDGYGSLREFLDDVAPCDCCSIEPGSVNKIGNGCDTEEEAIAEAETFLVVLEDWDQKEHYRIRAGSTKQHKNAGGWFAVPTSYVVEKLD